MSILENMPRRTLLKTATAFTVAGVLGACDKNTSNYHKTTQNSPQNPAEHSTQGYDCYGVHQAGIATPHQPFAIFSAFDISINTIDELKKMFWLISQRIEFLTKGGQLHDPDPKLPPSGSGILGQTIPADGLTITVSVGESLFDKRFGLADKKPKHLTQMKDFPNDKLQSDWCDGDFSLQICAFSPETCQNALRDLIKQLSAYAAIKWSIDGFLPKSPQDQAPRNLFGFRDGSANPDVSNAQVANDVLWTGIAKNAQDEPSWTKNGTYQTVRLIRHFVEFWDRTPLQEQQTIFGREKYSGAPLGMKHEHDVPDYQKDPDGDSIPKDSHIRLANSRDPDFMKKHLLYRRPYNYSRGLSKASQLDVGLIFICYQANLDDGFIFVQNLLNGEPLEEYISPFGGGYFFTLPGFEKNGYLGQSLLEG